MNTHLESVLSAFQIHQAPFLIQKIDIGHINHTYKVIGKRETYLLQKINTSIFQKPKILMNNIYKVSEHLKKQDYAYGVLEPFRTSTGDLYYKDEHGDNWRLMIFFENTYSINQVKSKKQAEQGGKMFGHFMNALKDIDPQQLGFTIPDFHNGKLRWQQFEAALEHNIANRVEVNMAFIQQVQSAQDIFQSVNELVSNGSLPTRITHNDTKINNLLFNKITHAPHAIIDWDTIMPATILSDYGDMVRTFANSVDEEEAHLDKVYFDIEIFKSLTKSFLSEAQIFITHIEKKQLINGAIWMIYMQVLRFLTDYINGDNYYPIRYENHNLNRAKNQMAYLEDILKHEKEMKRIIDYI